MVSLKRKLKRGWDRWRDFSGGSSSWNDPPPEMSSPDPYQIGWNERTLTPMGLQGPPTPDMAPRYQFLGEQKARELQARLFGDARGQIDTAMGIFSRYRLGGRNAGAMLSLFQNQAQLLGHEAGLVQTPDFMYRVREDAAIKAARAQERASRMALAGGIIQSLASVAGAAATGGTSLALPAAINAGGNVASSLITANGRGGPGATDPYGAPAGSPPPQMPQLSATAMSQPWTPQQTQQYQQGMQNAMGGSPGWTPGGPQPAGGAFPSGGGGGGAFQSQLPGQAGGGGGGGPGVGPGQGGGAGAPAGARAPGGGAQAPGQGGAMGMQGPPNGGYGQDGDFTPKALASASVRTDPDVEEIVTLAYASWLQEDRSTDHWESVVSGRLLRWAGAA